MLLLDGNSWAHTLRFAPDGSQLVVGRADGHVDVWALPAGKLVQTLGPFNRPNPTVCIHPGCRFLFLGGRGPFSVVPLGDGAISPVATGNGHVEQIVVSTDGTRVAVKVGSRDQTLLLGFRCDAAGALTLAWEASNTSRYGAVGGFARDGALVAIEGPRVYVRDPQTGTIRSHIAYPANHIIHLTVSPDGSRFASMGWEKLYVWDTVVWGKPTRVDLHGGRRLRSFAFHPNRPLFAAVQERQTLVKFFDTNTWKVATKFQWKLGEMRSVAFSPDGTLASACSATGKIVVWDVD
jgi:WD40 repeat protein